MKGENIMKKVILFIVAVTLIGTSVLAADNYTGQYKKKNGEVNVQMLSDKQIKFWINTVVGMNPCNIGEDGDAVATFVDKNRAAFSGEGKCVVVLKFEKNKLTITSKDCDGYCGSGSEGSIDGTYMKKSSKPSF